MRVPYEVIAVFAFLLALTILPCCSPGNFLDGFWTKGPLDHLSRAKTALDVGKLDEAIKEVNRDIRINGPTTSNLLLRVRIYKESGSHDEARKDIFAVHDMATQIYYVSNDPYGLYITAYCLGVLGDEERAKTSLHLLRKRYPYFSLTDTEEKVTELLEFWRVNRL